MVGGECSATDDSGDGPPCPAKWPDADPASTSMHRASILSFHHSQRNVSGVQDLRKLFLKSSLSSEATSISSHLRQVTAGWPSDPKESGARELFRRKKCPTPQEIREKTMKSNMRLTAAGVM